MQEAQLVMPGDFVSTLEEYTPGEGVYEEEGKLYASRMGHVRFDSDEFQARVEPVTETIIEVAPNMEIIGQVFRIKESAVVLKVLAIVEEGTRIPVDLEATLHVSKVARGYVENLRDHFRLLDIVRAGVMSANPSVQVETAYDAGGVIGAICSVCKRQLEQRGDQLWCDHCERREQRHLSSLYGQGVPLR